MDNTGDCSSEKTGHVGDLLYRCFQLLMGVLWNDDIKLRTAFTTPYSVSEAPSVQRVSKGVTFTSAGFAATCVVLSKKYLWCGSLELPCGEVNGISQAFQFPTGLLYPSTKQMQRRRFSHTTLVFAYKWRICYRGCCGLLCTY